MNHILWDENLILDFTLGSGILHYMPMLEPWKCGFVCLTSGMFWLLNPPGCRTVTGSQRGICPFFGSLLLGSSQKWPRKSIHIGNPDMRNDRNIMRPFPVVLKFLPTQLPCDQRVAHLPHHFLGGTSGDSQIIPSIPLFCLSPPSPRASEVAG